MKKRDRYSPVENDIINYILRNSDDVLEMTISQLAKATFSSNASIMRLSHKLGVKGFKEFKIVFAKELEKSRINKKNVDFNYPFSSQSNAHEVCNDISKLMQSSIEKCYQEIDVKTFRNVNKIILSSKKIYLFATGDNYIRAMSFFNKLIKLGICPIDATLFHEESTYSNYVTKEDCVIFISYRGLDKQYRRWEKICKSRGSKIVVITANEKSPLVTDATEVILIPDKEDIMNSIAAFYSQIAFEYVLNVLYSLIYLEFYDENKKKKKQTKLV